MFYLTKEYNFLKPYRKKFKEIITPKILEVYIYNLGDKYKYEEDEITLYEITVDGKNIIQNKCHPRFIICFLTKSYLGIKPTQYLIQRLYKSIFNNIPLEIVHIGEKLSNQPIKIGNLKIYNNIKIYQKLHVFSEKLLNLIQDAVNRKIRNILQYYFCEFWKKNLKERHIRNMFDFIMDFIIVHEINFEFKSE